MKKRFPKKEYHVPLFDELGYVRKLCPKCGENFWTLTPEKETCGEASPKGCAVYTFIGNPPTRRAYSFREMREAFLSFFEKRGHKRMKPYPVVSRWRDDLYLTSASIVDFQPYVTNGIAPPPANPLVISQPCIRLVDVDNTGPTFGRHGTFFEMGGHHAFNYPKREVYWKNETVQYHHEFATEELGIRSEDIVYKEDVWTGGGNAGPDLETIVAGMELATLVFMKFQVVGNGFVELPIRTVDTGYGIERYTWISQGSVSGFHAVYGEVLDKVLEMAGIGSMNNILLEETAKLSGNFSLERGVETADRWEAAAKEINIAPSKLAGFLQPIEKAFAVIDHTKSLAFMLAEGVVPSNAQEGYLARLLFRRTYRLLKALSIEDKLDEIVDLQIEEWSEDYPYLSDMRKEIIEMLAVERQKFEGTLMRGKTLVTRIAQDLKAEGQNAIPTETLVELYDSHGLPPEAVREGAAKEGIDVETPEGFYKMVAERHLQAPPQKATADERLDRVADLPETRMIYYEHPYQTTCESRVVGIVDGNQVALKETVFFPEGGGQPADSGTFKFDGKKAEVIDVQKVGRVIIHVLKGAAPRVGQKIMGRINWERRHYLMRAHTATHLVMGAARRVLGQHVWQTGTQKGVDRTRLDITHYRRLTPEEIREIEALANRAVTDTIPVEAEWLPRDEAEAKYGFRLYQGGAVPGKDVRVVRAGDWEVEACAGMHVQNTGEIGFIKIVDSERVQDGVERLVYATGRYAVEASQEGEKLLRSLSDALDAPVKRLLPTTQRLLKEWKEVRSENKRLIEELATLESGRSVDETTTTKEVDGVRLVTQRYPQLNVDRMIRTASRLIEKEETAVALFYGQDGKTARFVVLAGKEAVKRGANASEIANETAKLLGGGGSGRPEFAQGGGKTGKLDEAVARAEETLKRQLQKETK